MAPKFKPQKLTYTRPSTPYRPKLKLTETSVTDFTILKQKAGL